MEDYPKLTEAVANVLTQLREDAGLSKRKLAILTTIDRVYLLQIEQRKYRPTLNAIFLLAQAFGISPGYMVTLIDRECQRLVNAPSASEE